MRSFSRVSVVLSAALAAICRFGRRYCLKNLAFKMIGLAAFFILYRQARVQYRLSECASAYYYFLSPACLDDYMARTYDVSLIRSSLGPGIACPSEWNTRNARSNCLTFVYWFVSFTLFPDSLIRISYHSSRHGIHVSPPPPQKKETACLLP